MLISAVAALALFAAPEATQSGDATAGAAKPAAEAKVATKRVCEVVELSGSRLPKKKCRDVPVKEAQKDAEKATEAAPPS